MATVQAFVRLDPDRAPEQDAFLRSRTTVLREAGGQAWVALDEAQVASLVAQGLQVSVLDDAGLMARLFNRRAWVFLLLSDEGKRLPTLEEKRCYAVLAEAASQRLAQAAAGSAAPADPWPPSGCPRPPLHVAEVLADDLCRYVDGPQAAATPTAKALRMGLQQAADCPKL